MRRTGIDHFDLVVSSLTRSLPLYRELLGALGYTAEKEITGERGERVVYLSGSRVVPLGLRETMTSEARDRYRVGIHHVAFQASSRETVDERLRWARAHDLKIESDPREYEYRPGYYAGFFYDPDGVKLEIVHVPTTDAVPDLRGKLVVLRPVQHSDAACLREIHVEPAVAAWWGSMEKEFPFDEPQSPRFTIWVGDVIAGMIQYGEEQEPMYRHAWIDLFVSTLFHGRGVGTDAVRTLVRYLVDERCHHRVTIDPSLDNGAAVRAYEKAGFQRIGVMRLSERSPEGVWRDALLMEQVFPEAAARSSNAH